LIYGIAISRFLCVAPLAMFPGGDVADLFQQIPGVFGRTGQKNTGDWGNVLGAI